jgi:hypothetical protein
MAKMRVGGKTTKNMAKRKMMGGGRTTKNMAKGGRR